MSSTRLRTWIGGHPVCFASAVTGACLCALLLMILIGIPVAMARNWPVVPIALSAVAVLAGIIVWSTAWAGCLLGRSGHRPRRVLHVLLWLPGIVLLWFAAGMLLSGDMPGLDMLVPVVGYCLPIAALQLLGWAIAALITRHRIRTGKWETIVPFDAAGRPETRP